MLTKKHFELRTKVGLALHKKLKKIMEFYGIKEYSEILRLLIANEHRRITNSNDKIEKVRLELMHEIKLLEKLIESLSHEREHKSEGNGVFSSDR